MLYVLLPKNVDRANFYKPCAGCRQTTGAEDTFAAVGVSARRRCCAVSPVVPHTGAP